MNGFLRLILACVFVVTTASCTSTSNNDSGLESSDLSEETFEDFGGDDTSVADGDELSLEDELNDADGLAESSAEPSGGEPALDEEFAMEEPLEEEPLEEVPPATIAEEPPATPDPNFADDFGEDPLLDESSVAQAPEIEATPEPEMEPMAEPIPEPEVAQPSAPIVNITNIRFKTNDNGGTVIVDADGPLDYSTRKNDANNQLVIEIPNSKLPNKLKRPFITKDMAGLFGSIDAYQNDGSTTSRIVLQLREGVSEPFVQNEGNSLLMVASLPSGSTGAVASSGSEAIDQEFEEQSGTSASRVTGEQGILSSASLEEFLSGSTQFYGKKISIETSEMDIREVFKFLSEESGVNLVLNDSVKGTVSLKLRQVPWDQALVMIMKTNKLGYTRSGDVLRIAPIADIRTEEEDAAKLVAARKAQTPLKVRVIPISYAKVDDITNQVKPFLSERGRVVAEARTSAVVVSDLDENIERVMKLIQSIDVPPTQVLIEGKVVEATDSFQRNIGVGWAFSGRQFDAGGMRGRAGLQISPGFGANRSLNLSFQLGTLDVLGDLTASLQLYESTGDVKVLSSPRVVALHNESAEINQTTQIPIVTSTKDAAGNITPTVQFKDITLKLGVTPQITNDGAVIMQVDVAREFAGAAPDQDSPAPPVNSRKAKTKVLVRNGQTAVIGGIYQNDQNSGFVKVPILGDIPFLGWLFKSRTEKTDKNELMIFLTPRILNHSVVGSTPKNDIMME